MRRESGTLRSFLPPFKREESAMSTSTESGEFRGVQVALMVCIATCGFALGVGFAKHVMKKPAACPAAVSCPPVVQCGDRLDTGSSLTPVTEEIAPTPIFRLGQRIRLAEDFESCFDMHRKACNLKAGGELTVLENSGKSDLTKGTYVPPSKSRRERVYPDPKNLGLNECPKGLVAFSRVSLDVMLTVDPGVGAREERQELDRIFPR